jgi:pimeloyl-ACP methyl ester carboxylesterase
MPNLRGRVGSNAKRCTLLMLTTLALTTVTLVAPPAPATADSLSCSTVSLPVVLSAGSQTTYSVWGQLCGAAPGRPVEVLSHGITYSHTYWDWPYQPSTYSYVRYANAHGRATFDYDRIGEGNSSRPPATSVTIPANAFVLHQIVGALRSGQLGTPFNRIISIGHSLGSLIAMEEAGQYHDVDAVALSGISHSFVTVGVALLFPDFVPTQLDPVLAPQNFPLGYVTTRAGTREEHFYYAPTADPAVVALDEATKQAGTAGELATLPVALPFSLSITAPVLVINGDNDQLICGGILPCSSALNPFNTESTFYPAAASYTQVLIPNMGHDMTLQTNAPEFFADVDTWITSHLN